MTAMLRRAGGLRVLLVGLLLLATVPAIAVIEAREGEERDERIEELSQDALTIAESIAYDHVQFIEASHRLLDALSYLPEVRNLDEAGCSRIVRDLVARWPQYRALGAMEPNGDLFCRSVAERPRINLAEADVFRGPMTTRAFTIGDYKGWTDRQSPSLVLSSPVIEGDEVVAVLTATVDLNQRGRVAARSGWPEHALVLVVAADGTVVSSFPERDQWARSSEPRSPIFQALLADDNPVIDTDQVDGVRRFFARQRLPGPVGEPAPQIVVGIPVDTMFEEAQRRLAWDIRVLAVVTLATLAAALVGLELLVMRPVDGLIRATRRLQGGDLSARTPSRVGPRELGELGRDFNAMVDALERRDRERRVAEEALRISEERHRRMVETAQEGIWEIDADGRTTFANRKMAEMFATSVDEMLGAPVFDFVSEGRRATTAQHVEQLRHGMSLRVESSLRARDGRDFWVILAASPLQDAAGRYVGALALVTDIAERKQAEEDLKERTRLAELSAEIGVALTGTTDLQAMLTRCAEAMVGHLDAAFARIWTLDGDSGVLELKASAGLYTHLDGPHSRVPVGALKIGLIASEGKPHLTNQVIGDSRVGDQEWARREGMVAFAGYPLIVADRTVGVMAMFACRPLSDFTLRALATVSSQVALGIERKQAEAERERLLASEQAALAELRATQQQVIQQERLRALGQMASGIAHDFNNALAPIVAYSELLLAQPDRLVERERVISFIDMIQTCAQDAAGVVRRLREFYRAQEVDEVVEPVPLEDLIAQVMSLTQFRWKDQAQAAGTVIVVTTDIQVNRAVAGIRANLREALTNLIFNAVDAMPEGGTIAIGAREDGEAVVLEVRDTGVGMTEEVRLRCLEPFFTTKGEHGTGLGLGLVYGIVKRHRGTLEIESTPGEGTTVRMQLPLWSDRDSAAELTDGPAAQSVLRVLVIEDEPMVRRALAEYLTLDGHQVETASNGQDGLVQFRQGRFDLVLTDRALPGMSGDQVAAGIKEQAPDVPVIMVTGFGDLMNHHHERPSAVDLVLGKPVTIAVLRDAISRVAS